MESSSSSSGPPVWLTESFTFVSCCLFLPLERVFGSLGLGGLGSCVEVFAVAVVAAALLDEFLGLETVFGGAGVAALFLRGLGPCVGVFFSGGWVAVLVVFCAFGVSCLLPLA